MIVDSSGNPFSLAAVTGREGTQRGGHVISSRTGHGGNADKSMIGAYFQPSVFNNRYFFDSVYGESWAAQKFIDIPVDDMFIRPRRFIGDDEAAAEAVDKIVRRVRAYRQFSMAMKAARLYGTAFLVMVFGDGRDAAEPLDMERIGERYPLNAMHVVDRFCVEPVQETIIGDVADPDFGRATQYRIFPSTERPTDWSRSWTIHASRLVRFDGRESLTAFGWASIYDRRWGLSELQSALVEILYDAGLAQAVSHLSAEASVSVFKVAGVREAITGDAADDDVTPEKYAQEINRNKSNFRSVFVDLADEFVRNEVNFTGLSQLLDKFAERLAAMADIPATRFLGRSPTGLQSTGEHEMINYAVHVAARQVRFQREAGDDFDKLLAKAAGLEEFPEFEWPSLMELQSKDRIEEVKAAVEALHMAWADGIIDEQHYAEQLSQYDDVFGSVPTPPELDPMMPPPSGMPGPPPPPQPPSEGNEGDNE